MYTGRQLKDKILSVSGNLHGAFRKVVAKPYYRFNFLQVYFFSGNRLHQTPLKMNAMDNNCFVTSKAEILHELLRSRAEGNALGIWSASLGPGMFLCTVKEICTDEDEEDIMIILKEDELTAPRIDNHVVYLYEIDRVYTFRSQALRKMNC